EAHVDRVHAAPDRRSARRPRRDVLLARDVMDKPDRARIADLDEAARGHCAAQRFVTIAVARSRAAKRKHAMTSDTDEHYIYAALKEITGLEFADAISRFNYLAA